MQIDSEALGGFSAVRVDNLTEFNSNVWKQENYFLLMYCQGEDVIEKQSSHAVGAFSTRLESSAISPCEHSTNVLVQ